MNVKSLARFQYESLAGLIKLLRRQSYDEPIYEVTSVTSVQCGRYEGTDSFLGIFSMLGTSWLTLSVDRCSTTGLGRGAARLHISMTAWSRPSEPRCSRAISHGSTLGRHLTYMPLDSQ